MSSLNVFWKRCCRIKILIYLVTIYKIFCLVNLHFWHITNVLRICSPLNVYLNVHKYIFFYYTVLFLDLVQKSFIMSLKIIIKIHALCPQSTKLRVSWWSFVLWCVRGWGESVLRKSTYVCTLYSMYILEDQTNRILTGNSFKQIKGQLWVIHFVHLEKALYQNML